MAGDYWFMYKNPIVQVSPRASPTGFRFMLFPEK